MNIIRLIFNAHKKILFFTILILCAFLCGAQTRAGEEGVFKPVGIAVLRNAVQRGSVTASGEIYDPQKPTAAHPSLPFGTLLNITNLINNTKTSVRVNDRTKLPEGVIIEVSYAAAAALGILATGSAQVRIEVIRNGPLPGKLPNFEPDARRPPPRAPSNNIGAGERAEPELSPARNPSGTGGLAPNVRALVNEAVFEVVIKKPSKETLVYDRDPDWTSIPYAIRSDNYHSIGTAFAISAHELVTAFHVMDLSKESAVYPQFFVRDSFGAVFEADEITGGSSERDFVVFTIKGRRHNNYFTLKNEFEINEPVYSIGNALGEGVIVRAGLLLGTVPEAESGRWQLLKSSADGNPGNSGGPLVTRDGSVIGLVTGIRENILYSTPSSVITSFSRTKFEYRAKQRYEHIILTNKLSGIFEHSVTLPAPYKNLRSELIFLLRAAYAEKMEALFKEAPEYLTGEHNAYLLNSSMSSIFPELDYVDDGGEWKLGSFKVQVEKLNGGGRLLYASVSSYNFFKIEKHKTPPQPEINFNVRLIMDTILEGRRTERNLGRGDTYRIRSFGEPSERAFYTDSLGRRWITAKWPLGFNDKMTIMFVLPQPDGPSVILASPSSSDEFYYDWDMRKMCDHIHAAYSGTYDDWKDFISETEYVPPFLKNFSFDINLQAGTLRASHPDFSFFLNNKGFNITSDSEIYLLPAYYELHKKIEFGITKVILNKDARGRDYFVLLKTLKPDQKLDREYHDEWDDIIKRRFPLNDRPAFSPNDNSGSIGGTIDSLNPDDDARWSLYLVLEGVRDNELSLKFSELKKEITIRR